MIDDGEVRAGMRWRDVTVVGIKPAMQITRMEPFRLWQESGRWRNIEALLTLRFTPVAEGTRVTAEVSLEGSRIGRLVSRLAPLAIRADLARAARALERR